MDSPVEVYINIAKLTRDDVKAKLVLYRLERAFSGKSRQHPDNANLAKRINNAELCVVIINAYFQSLPRIQTYHALLEGVACDEGRKPKEQQNQELVATANAAVLGVVLYLNEKNSRVSGTLFALLGENEPEDARPFTVAVGNNRDMLRAVEEAKKEHGIE